MRTGRAEATASHSSASRRRQWGPNWPWPPHLLTPETRSSSGGGRKCLPGLLASSPAKGLALCPPRGRGPCKRGHKTGEGHLCPGLHCSGKPTPPPGAEESFSQPPTETPRAREGVWSGGGTLRLVPPPHLLHPCVPRPTFCAPPPWAAVSASASGPCVVVWPQIPGQPRVALGCWTLCGGRVLGLSP